jgi:hypothetical protein
MFFFFTLVCAFISHFFILRLVLMVNEIKVKVIVSMMHSTSTVVCTSHDTIASFGLAPPSNVRSAHAWTILNYSTCLCYNSGQAPSSYQLYPIHTYCIIFIFILPTATNEDPRRCAMYYCLVCSLPLIAVCLFVVRM